MEIPRCDRAPLSLLCGVQESEPLPAVIEKNYWRARRMFSRVAGCGPLPPAVIVQIGLVSGLGEPIKGDERALSFEDFVRDGKVKPNDAIIVLWRNQPVEVTFLRLTNDHRVKFLMEGKKGEMAVPIADARMKE